MLVPVHTACGVSGYSEVEAGEHRILESEGVLIFLINAIRVLSIELKFPINEMERNF